MSAAHPKKQFLVNFTFHTCTFGSGLCYNSGYGIVHDCVTRGASPSAIQPKPAKEAVPIDPKQQRHLSTQGAKVPGDAPNSAKGGKKPAKKKRRSIFGMIMRFIGCLICVCIMLGSVGAVLLAMYVVQVTADPEGKLDLEKKKDEQSTIFFDRNGDEYTTLSGDVSSLWVNLSDIPENLQHAVVAIEDKDFYDSIGVNFKRTIAAALNELTGQQLLGGQQGASTLEQQLVKNLTDDNEVDYMRKVREIFRAIGLSNRYSKETILEAYLNTVPLTGTIQGVEAGANTYFGKSVGELSLSECAVLASISKNPTGYNPFTNPENLIQRRNHVLYEMLNQGYITQEEYDSATAETITLAESKSKTENVAVSSNNSYFTEAVITQLTADLKEAYNLETDAEAQDMIFNGGLRVYTTVDPAVQNSVEQLMLNNTWEGDELFYALWHEEEIESDIPVGAEIKYDVNGLPMNPTDESASSIFAQDDVPVYTDKTNQTFKTGTYKAEDGNEYLTFYEEVRTQAAIAVTSTEAGHKGEVIAVGGGLGEKTVDRGINRAVVPHQTGSTMKPIAAYCLALDDHLINYSTALEDSPLYTKEGKEMLDTEKCLQLGLSLDPNDPTNQARSDVWKEWPTNYGGAGGDGAPMLIWDAIRQSYNTIAVKVGSMVGVDYMYDFVTETLQCQWINENDADLAPLVLGAHNRGLTVVELANAYSMFTDGTYTTPHYYTRVEDYQGNVVLDMDKVTTTTQAIEPETAVIMNRLLANVWTSPGTANGMKPETEGIDAVGKTGTTSDYKDYTFAGLSPYYSIAVWWGYDKPYCMWGVDGSRGNSGKPTQRAFKTLMEEIQADKPAANFYTNENVHEYQFNTSTGAIVSSGGRTGYYTDDNLPDSSSASLLSDDAAALGQLTADALASADPAA